MKRAKPVFVGFAPMTASVDLKLQVRRTKPVNMTFEHALLRNQMNSHIHGFAPPPKDFPKYNISIRICQPVLYTRCPLGYRLKFPVDKSAVAQNSLFFESVFFITANPEMISILKTITYNIYIVLSL